MRAWRGSWGCSLEVPHPRSPGDAQAPAGPAQSLTIHEDSNISVPITWRLRKLLLHSGHSPAGGILCQVKAEHKMINNFLIMYLVTNKAGFEHMNPFHQSILCVKGQESCLMILVANEGDLIWWTWGKSPRNKQKKWQSQLWNQCQGPTSQYPQAFRDTVKQHIPEKGRKPNGGGTGSPTPIHCREWCWTGLRPCSTVTVNGPVLQAPSLPHCAANHF